MPCVSQCMCVCVCVCEKNVVHCASTMAIFNVQIVSNFYIFKMDFIMFVRDSNSIIKYIYYVECAITEKNVNYLEHIKTKDHCVTHTRKPQFTTMYAIQQQIHILDVQLTTQNKTKQKYLMHHCNFIGHNMK